MENLRDDVRQALRAMSRQKGLTAAALVSLALGIGANTALFSVTYSVLLRPLPYAAAPALLLAVAVLACLLPAWRAAAVEPTEALRCE